MANPLDLLGFMADTLGILGAIFAFFAWIEARRTHQELEHEKRRMNRRINVVLQNGAERLELPVQLRRAELTRSEVLGRIGMIPMNVKGQRFTLEYLNTPGFLEQVNQIVGNDGEGTLTIPCKGHELEQFDLP